MDDDDVREMAKLDVKSILNIDMNEGTEKRRDKDKMKMLLKSLARNEASIVGNKTIIKDIEEYENGTINFNYQENGEIALKDDAVFYKVDNRVRKVWEVTIYYDYYKYKENGAERYVYYVDCTTGEIIGGSRWNGAKRQIESLMNDTYNYIKN